MVLLPSPNLNYFHLPPLPSYDASFYNFFNTSFFRSSISSCFRFSSCWICFVRISTLISISSGRIGSVFDHRMNESDLGASESAISASESAISASESAVCLHASTNASSTPSESASEIANVSFSWSKSAISNAWLFLPVTDAAFLPCDADMEMDACRRRSFRRFVLVSRRCVHVCRRCCFRWLLPPPHIAASYVEL